MKKTFFDTNVLVYAADRARPGKRDRARALIRAGLAERSAVISTQVLQEYFVTVTRKLGVDPLAAKSTLSAFGGFELVQVSKEIIDRAIDVYVLEQISFWDALIVSAARSAACDELLTEDLNPDHSYAGVLAVDPFDLATREA
ncbi:MAG: PIN domain-containing protein [Polyangia bacterium]